MRRGERKSKKGIYAPPHRSELNEAVFGKRSQEDLAKMSQESNVRQYRMIWVVFYMRNKALYKKNEKENQKQKRSKATPNGQVQKRQLPEGGIKKVKEGF